MSKQRRVRRLWEDDEKIRIVAQTRVPGVSVSQVARRYDVNANLVFRWLGDPRFNRLSVEEPTASFLPVEVVGEPQFLDPSVINAPVGGAPALEAGASESKIEIVSPSGHRISVSGAYDPVALCRLVQGVGS